jgi:thiamine kinase-like enzyme
VHRDAGPYNWRVTDDGAVRLVDWEHARADHAAVGLAAVVGLAHPDDPHVRAFLDGYGASPDDEARLPAAVSLRADGAHGTDMFGAAEVSDDLDTFLADVL